LTNDESRRPTVAWLCGALGLKGDDTPFPWQEELLNQFQEEKIPSAIDVPTGLGKTAVMAVWLVARAVGARLPRRLAYVVDRRAVVDQATEVAVALRGFGGRKRRPQAPSWASRAPAHSRFPRFAVST
jgi:CRISPR-associated helicase Cas3